MSDWWVPFISASAALAGVWLGDIRQRGREREARLAQIRKEAFIDLFAWELRAQDALRRLAVGDITDRRQGESAEMRSDQPTLPELSPELLARIYIYLDEQLARDARNAEAKLRDVAQDDDPERRRASNLDVAFALGAVSAGIEIRTKELESAPSTRLRWRIRRFIRPPLTTDDPDWRDLALRERWKRRLNELRRPSARRTPIEEEGVGPSL